ncbi:hypothetical protein GUJ93_ZPchr0013g36010 [Zizania palustris]|uniref:DUF4219 domain-containing protein n=1 Tax=Zizania palustris TaxID=103762 RepID=A0A8J5X1Q1_ZIZPA|nr:hypothetical protein GUJ93_ZPchr0013g36010 [Zizania palustris]
MAADFSFPSSAGLAPPFFGSPRSSPDSVFTRRRPLPRWSPCAAAAPVPFRCRAPSNRLSFSPEDSWAQSAEASRRVRALFSVEPWRNEAACSALDSEGSSAGGSFARAGGGVRHQERRRREPGGRTRASCGVGRNTRRRDSQPRVEPCTNNDMDRHSKIPLFDGKDFAYWKVRMEAYLLSQGSTIWEIVDSEYTIPETRITQTEKEQYECNNKGNLEHFGCFS